LFALFQRPSDTAAIELVRQFETGSYVWAKFRLGVSDPRTEATLYLAPLNQAEGLGPCLQTAPSFISDQVTQGWFLHLPAEQIAQAPDRFRQSFLNVCIHKRESLVDQMNRRRFPQRTLCASQQNESHVGQHICVPCENADGIERWR